MLGVKTIGGIYTDPCWCCIPRYGNRDFNPEQTEQESIDYVINANARLEQIDLIFTSFDLYQSTHESIRRISPNTKLIVACEREWKGTWVSIPNASELRKRGIPAIDHEDYRKSAPLNAVIALVCFNELNLL